MPNRTTAKVLVTKLTAARRQIDAAIRMKFAGEDSLAIHTVAAAAFNIVKDIKIKRGGNPYADPLSYGLYAVAHDIAAGKLKGFPSGFDNPKLREIIMEVVQLIRDTNFSITWQDLPVISSSNRERDYWKHVNKWANFLKHADNDHIAALDANELNTDYVLLAACSFFKELTKEASPEMRVYGIYSVIGIDQPINFDKTGHAIFEALKTCRPANRGRRCLKIIKMLKQQA